MKTKFNLFRRAGVFYMEDTATGKQTSLRTKDEAEAKSLLNARNEASRQPVLNLHIARAYLTASDPAFIERTAGGVLRGHDFGIDDLLSAGTIVESFVRPFIVQRLPGAVGGFGDHRHGLVHAFNAPSDDLRFEPIVT